MSLGGGGGGTDSIMSTSNAKSFKKRVGDVAKVLTFPFHKRRKDPTEKFASEEVNKKVPPVMSLGGGGGGTNSITDAAPGLNKYSGDAMISRQYDLNRLGKPSTTNIKKGSIPEPKKKQVYKTQLNN